MVRGWLVVGVCVQEYAKFGVTFNQGCLQGACNGGGGVLGRHGKTLTVPYPQKVSVVL